MNESEEQDMIKQQDNTAYLSRQQFQHDPLMSKHLNADEILEKLKKMLMGFEYDEEEDKWKEATITFINSDGQQVIAKQGPLMNPKDIRVTIGYLQMFLNPNTFLSQLDEDRINDIMWDVSKKLGVLFYRLRHRLSPETRDMIWGMIEYPILMALSRANKKITLDAMSKMQHSIEHIQGNQQQPQQKPPKEFKILGW